MIIVSITSRTTTTTTTITTSNTTTTNNNNNDLGLLISGHKTTGPSVNAWESLARGSPCWLMVEPEWPIVLVLVLVIVIAISL